MNNINLGDVVQLKSGGPRMTVRQYPFKDISGNLLYEYADCEWYDSNGELKHLVYKICELKDDVK